MDPRYCAQDVLLCNLCNKDVLQSHCEACNISLCLNCVGKHLSDPSKRHNVMPYSQRNQQQQHIIPNYPKCPKHSEKHCELYCESCDFPVCSTCLSSGYHRGHNLSDVLQKHSSKKESVKRDLEELQEIIRPEFQKVASDITAVKANLEKHYEGLTTAVMKQGEDYYREIEIIVNKRKSEIEEIRAKNLKILSKEDDEIASNVLEIKQKILDLEKILSSNDVTLAFSYISRNAEFRNLLPKPNATYILPILSPPKFNTEQLSNFFGSLSELSVTTDDLEYTLKRTESHSSPPARPLLDKSQLITTLFTNFTNLSSISCFDGEEIWTFERNIMELYNLQGKLMESIKTKSKNYIYDIAVMKSGDLVYADPKARTVNILKNKQIEEVIRLQEWSPYYVCSTFSNDLLVTMNSDDGQSKVIRYSGSTEKHTIQFDNKGVPLYSSDVFLKYVCENRNLDICVADNGASAVVVVNQEDELRFRYTGYPSSSKEPFCPYGITTDSQGHILISENLKSCIHILDQDGQFLQFLGNCILQSPWGLCVDNKDSLFVAQSSNGIVKKIKYM
ncbi:uncharacterized protein LOC133204288 [Saccostrea echinata]|uniref:uncharacterized protein LOC133204288 n=1 Tax=Saccostrea echinata TaxID=191078 RepID=UPI002A807408|nr:uncharacterized protein LOC133204288 [Saccostrea echinata]